MNIWCRIQIEKINIKERGPKFGVKLIELENVGRETH